MQKKFIIKNYQINITKPGTAGKPLRLVFFSDLHNAVYGENNNRLCREIRSLNPAAVLLGGDLMIAKPDFPIKPALDLVTALAAEHRVYYAIGNHEFRLMLYPEVYGNSCRQYFAKLRDAGVHLLDNQREEVLLGGIPVSISGFSLERKYYCRTSRLLLPVSKLEEKLGKPSPERFEILLAHNPCFQETYFEWGADLILAGHYHGGVMRLGKKRGAVSPDFHILSPKCYGMEKRGVQQMIITSGLGEHTIPFRIFNPRELVVLDIKST